MTGGMSHTVTIEQVERALFAVFEDTDAVFDVLARLSDVASVNVVLLEQALRDASLGVVHFENGDGTGPGTFIGPTEAASRIAAAYQ